MKNVTWWRLTRGLLAALLFALVFFGASGGAVAAADDKDDERVVIRRLVDCPAIQIGGGQAVQWIGRASRGFLGVEPMQLTSELRQHFGVPEESGIMIGRVLEGTAAEEAGLQVGDIITRIDGEEITSGGDLGRAVRQQDGGDSVEIELWRGGSRIVVNATLEEHERCALDLSHLHGLDIERLGNIGVELGGEALEALRGVDWTEALENLRAIDWEEHFEGLRMIDQERIEERMERTQQRLEALEKRLDREQARLEGLERDEREEVERALERANRDRERAERAREQAERAREQAERESKGAGADSGSEI